MVVEDTAPLYASERGDSSARPFAEGDRRGGIVLGAVLLVAIPALLAVRRRQHQATMLLVAIAAAQGIAAAVMIATGTGVTSVVVTINAILIGGWLLAAALFRARG